MSDSSATVVVVEHRERWLASGLSAWARRGRAGTRVLVVDPDEGTEDLVRAMIGVLTSLYAGLCGRQAARNRAIAATRQERGDG
ncbi:hypothetical protein [Mycolicibacterium sp. YH-1]|uniref:hypothetical protein n=1 Tax=Mycolicibacterium sp. YH-1 TaxID=2908837 RepID=UPI001F4C11C7|nr:hypothetical protein [Mycolicibacterium sp. YH-1]UNB52109.1 hypothetical protein L0M16_30260 [Mycolicibacterium sp. YH-1]